MDVSYDRECGRSCAPGAAHRLLERRLRAAAASRRARSTARPFEELVKERVLEPLGMTTPASPRAAGCGGCDASAGRSAVAPARKPAPFVKNLTGPPGALVTTAPRSWRGRAHAAASAANSTAAAFRPRCAEALAAVTRGTARRSQRLGARVRDAGDRGGGGGGAGGRHVAAWRRIPCSAVRGEHGVRRC